MSGNSGFVWGVGDHMFNPGVSMHCSLSHWKASWICIIRKRIVSLCTMCKHSKYYTHQNMLKAHHTQADLSICETSYYQLCDVIHMVRSKHHHTTAIDIMNNNIFWGCLQTYKLMPSNPAPSPIWSTPATFRKWFKWAARTWTLKWVNIVFIVVYSGIFWILCAT